VSVVKFFKAHPLCLNNMAIVRKFLNICVIAVKCMVEAHRVPWFDAIFVLWRLHI
jgi:hypothetical protein